MIRLTLPTLIFSAYLEVLIDIFGQLLHNLDKKKNGSENTGICFPWP
jgi:hypothetical protein